ncbi:MAG: hypothetical protein GY749_37670 [Desulfobacteraceae bacterium]|nr:hypothetical protein [Desulfobacteraceae bacterium]
MREPMRTHYENPLIHKAFSVLESLSADEKTRILAQKREESLMDERYELAAARKKGKKEGREEVKKEIAASLLNEGISPEQVMKCTGLSRDEIDRLEKISHSEKKGNH